MPSFKSKSAKNIKFNKKSIITLDSKHKDFLNEFICDEKTIEDYQKQIDVLKNKLYQNYNMNTNKTNKKSNKHTLTIEEQLDIKDKINDFKTKIKMFKNKKKKYLLDNSKYIFDYFEDKKNLSEGIKPDNIPKSKRINEFFKISDETKIDNANNDEIVEKNTVLNYLQNISDDFLNVDNFVYETDICKYCNKGELIPLEDEGILICNMCSRNVLYLVENEKPSYKEPPKEVCSYAYKRINHFKEIIAQFQGKETTQIPEVVIENIKQQIKKERIDVSQITYNKTKDILKKLDYSKYYEHIPFINEKFGIKPPIMTQELEETLCNLFFEIQAPYSKYCPNYRINFLNYYYTLFKLCELLGEYSYLEHIPKLKDDQKRMEQDEIWKKICIEKDWEFIPTL
jgi:hypothetical protein